MFLCVAFNVSEQSQTTSGDVLFSLFLGIPWVNSSQFVSRWGTSHPAGKVLIFEPILGRAEQMKVITIHQ